jgi:cell wall-associated NlpC family hydrolase
MKKRGIDIPQVSWLQIKQGNKVANGNDLSKAKPGDLLFFLLADGHKRSPVTNHVGVYLGNGMMSHAANPRRGTQTVKLDNYYMSQMVQVRRYGRLDQPNPTKADKPIITPSTPTWVGIQAKLNGMGW